MNTICPECEGGTLLYQAEEWEGEDRPAKLVPELFYCDTCEMTYTPEELAAFVIG